jgi:hypothetical protein
LDEHPSLVIASAVIALLLLTAAVTVSTNKSQTPEVRQAGAGEVAVVVLEALEDAFCVLQRAAVTLVNEAVAFLSSLPDSVSGIDREAIKERMEDRRAALETLSGIDCE